MRPKNFVGIQDEIVYDSDGKPAQKSLKSATPYSKDITDEEGYVTYVNEELMYQEEESVRWRKLDHQMLITTDKIIKNTRIKRRNKTGKGKRGS